MQLSGRTSAKHVQGPGFEPYLCKQNKTDEHSESREDFIDTSFQWWPNSCSDYCLGILPNSGPPKKRHKGWSPESKSTTDGGFIQGGGNRAKHGKWLWPCPVSKLGASGGGLLAACVHMCICADA